jgi:hypothetical protein
MQSEVKTPLPRCGVVEAIGMIAQQPSEAPPDPCSGVFAELPRHQPSRWLLSFLPALRALADHCGDGNPPAPANWLELEPRLRLRPPGSLWDFDLNRIWLDRVESMGGHCAASGRPPEVWIERWAPYEAAALAHLEACEQRNEALRRAAAHLHKIALGAHGPTVFGHDVRTGRFDEIERAALFDPAARWVVDPKAALFDSALVFTGGLAHGAGEFVDVGFAAADIETIVLSGQAGQPAPADRSLAAAVRVAARDVFPGGPPAGMTASTRNELIAARVVEMGARKPAPRTISEGIRWLWPARRQTAPHLAERRRRR